MFTYKARLHNCIFKEVIILLKFGAIRITFDFLGLLGLYTCFAVIPCMTVGTTSPVNQNSLIWKKALPAPTD